MNLIEKANLIEETEINFNIVKEGALRRGLTSLETAEIVIVLLQDLVIRAGIELCLKENR